MEGLSSNLDLSDHLWDELEFQLQARLQCSKATNDDILQAEWKKTPKYIENTWNVFLEVA